MNIINKIVYKAMKIQNRVCISKASSWHEFSMAESAETDYFFFSSTFRN